MSKKIAVLGAGPIGLEVALAFVERGHAVSVYERDTVGGNLDRWGHVRLFSPFGMNHSERGARVVESEGVTLPGSDAYLTGAEHRGRYLVPLARSARLRNRVHEHRNVLHVGRDGMGKNDAVGGDRASRPFRLLMENRGQEEIVEAEIVVDATGTYGNPNWMGNGGVPAKGERDLKKRIHYELVDPSGLNGKNVLVVGSGHSAATALEALAKQPTTTVHWVARKNKPLDVIENDPLPERKRLSELANALANGSRANVRFYPADQVEAVRSGFQVDLSDGTRLEVDEILALVGYHPDATLYRELQVHECYASLAPMKLAAALLGDKSHDCLAQTSKGPETLVNPEPNFFILGAKSYGKNSNFLIRVGLEQIEELLELVETNERKERVS